MCFSFPSFVSITPIKLSFSMSLSKGRCIQCLFCSQRSTLATRTCQGCDECPGLTTFCPSKGLGWNPWKHIISAAPNLTCSNWILHKWIWTSFLDLFRLSLSLCQVWFGLSMPCLMFWPSFSQKPGPCCFHSHPTPWPFWNSCAPRHAHCTVAFPSVYGEGDPLKSG